MTFPGLVGAAEALGAGRGLPQVLELYRDWIAAQPPGTPDLHAAWFNYGTELGHSGASGGAVAAYQAALALRPGFHPAAVNLGLLLERLGQPGAALAVWTDALQPDAARIALLNQRARLLENRGDLADSAELLRTSLLTSHQQPDAVQHWLHIRQKMCQWPVLAEVVPGLSQQDMISQSGPLAALALTDDVPTQRAIAAGFIARKVPPAPVRLAPPGGYRHDRIRVGYLSSDFCSHAMCYLIAELFERHDRARFEVFGYCASPDDGSPVRARVIAAFDHFVSIKTVSDEVAARRIRDDEIDILIDLNGLTAGGRLQVVRWKPAPVQATYLGFIGPVPLPELDYILCDDFVVPAGVAADYLPAPLYIPGMYQANDSKRIVGAPVTRAQAGLPEGRFAFCCFSNHYKITEAMFAAWMEILRQTGDSVLWLVDDNIWSRQNLRLRAMIAGIDPARLIFAGRVDPATYMARLAVADLFLDTFPYNAGTVASDVIRMGLPMLTLAGRSFASRMAARMLHAIGADAGVATDYPDYVATAVGLATNPDRQAAYRALFTEQAWAATIGDIAGFTERFEATLRRIRLTPVTRPLEAAPA
jgi:predicted O-linked N-acetylglucosamine transferase (SPINDLY family)